MWCSFGQHETSEEKFYKRTRNGKQTFQSGCIDCRKDYNRNHYKENRDVYVEKALKHNKAHAKWVAELKVGKPCNRCSRIGHPGAMHWHHLRDKNFLISEAARKYGKERILKELEKCELLCADCHAEETWGPAKDYINLFD